MPLLSFETQNLDLVTLKVFQDHTPDFAILLFQLASMSIKHFQVPAR